MTSIERMQRFLKRESHDRIPVYEHFWSDTKRAWVNKEKITQEDELNHIFDFDMTENWAFNYVADLDFIPQTLDETEDTILVMDGNGAKLKRHKKHDATPEHVGFSVTDRASWEALKEKISPEKRRINFEAYIKEKNWARDNDKFFCWSGTNVFEQMHPVCGHEYMLMGMALDPGWIHDMAKTYAELNINLMEELFATAGKPDGIWFYEDMGFKLRPFMSPQMYNEIIKPYHKMTIDYAKSQRLPVIMHSCGFVEPILPGILEAGIDCLQVIEVKAGMDAKRIYDNYGERLSLMGGIDVRELYSNDKVRIKNEIKDKLPYVMGHYGYALHSDHSIPGTVDYDMYKYFIREGIKLGTY
jgi:uroporphyrinogen decarboxylase